MINLVLGVVEVRRSAQQQPIGPLDYRDLDALLPQELAQHHQVICVTHLPQMASYATAQWAIRKRVERGRTRTTISPVRDAERVEELALMLRGDSAAEGTRREARAMLLEAEARR